MNRALTIAITTIILLVLIFPLSQIAGKKRVIVIKGAESSLFKAESLPLAGDNFYLKKDKQRINAIFLGIPGQGNNAPDLTDTLIVLSMNQETKQGFLLSIPRDLLVKIPEKNYYTKINAVYQEQGIETVQNILSQIIGLDFDYNIVVELEGVKKIIDQLGGIDVFVEKDIYDPNFPGPGNSYQVFSLEKGWQHLDGETALKYVRTRYDAEGDFARINRQQGALIALKEKLSSLHPVWNIKIILDIWKTLTSHWQTNLSLFNIKTIWNIVKDFNLETIEFKALNPSTGLVVPDQAMLGEERAYILRPATGLDNYSEIKSFIQNLIQ